jgi:hypothetical protein
MKKSIINFRNGVVSTLILTTFLTCTKKGITEEKPTGFLSLKVGMAVAVFDVHSHLKAANPDDFIVNIFSDDGELVESFARAADIPENIPLPEGTYYAEAYSDNNLPAAFENDYYYGVSDPFDILAGQTSSISITCKLANIMVSVIYSDNVISGFDDYSTTVSNSGGSLLFAATETRAGYFSEGPLNIEAVLLFDDGSGTMESKILSGIIQGAEAGKHYQILIDAAMEEGEAGIELIVDESYETELVVISEEGPVAGPGTGDLLITEIMYNPAVISDTEGEWIEIYNNSATDYNLLNVIFVRVSTDDRHTIGSDIILSPGDHAVLARTAAAADQVDYVYGSSISLPNTGDELQLYTYGSDGTDGDLICRVDYGAVNFNTGLSGVSIQLDPSITDPAEAMDGLNWCESTLSYSADNLGTPGEANTDCP